MEIKAVVNGVELPVEVDAEEFKRAFYSSYDDLNIEVDDYGEEVSEDRATDYIILDENGEVIDE